MKYASSRFFLSFFTFLLSFFILSSCASATQPASQPQVVTVYASPAAGPWLTRLYDCAEKLSVVLNVNAEEPDIYLRLGEPENLASPAYQIGTEDVLVVTNRESPVQNLTLEQMQTLFVEQGDPSIQVWVYASDEDIQQVFDQFVMKGRGVTSFARLAASPQEMSAAVNADANAVGFLSRHWMTSSMRVVYTIPSIPVLAVTKTEPVSATRGLIACLQK